MLSRYQVACGILLCFSNVRAFALRAFALLAFALLALPLKAEDFADQLPRIPPTSPQDAMKAFQIADGYEMQLVASEPLIGSPVAIEWDATGRMYVCEMRGYSENRDDKISTIALLTDTDNDGVYDHRTEYASGLFWPTAIFPFDGGLFVGDAPDLLYLKDTDGDGVADTRETVLTGFGVSNVQGLLNSMRWGLDNRIHIACSSTGGQIKVAAGDHEPVNIRGRDLSFDPRTFAFTPTSGAAQHGMCFDDWGRKFASSNSNHIMQVMFDDDAIAGNPYVSAPSSRVSIATDGPQAEVFRTSPVEPWRIVRTRLRVSGSVPGPIEGGGRAAGYFTGATGITIYRGDAWPTKDKGLAIVGDVGSNLIHRKRLEPNGLPFKALRIDPKSEFVTSTDIWFRPAQFANAPDGSLHVIDVCREVIEHPKSLPPEIKRHLDLTAGRDRGRIYRLVPQEFQHRRTPNLEDADAVVLVSFLGHANAWHRETAARLLFERQDKSAVVLLKNLIVESQQPLAILHAMYVIDGMGELTSESLLPLLSHPHEQIRCHAVRLASRSEFLSQVADKIIVMADDPSLAVRTEVAYAIGKIKHPRRQYALASIVKRDQTVWTRIAVQSAVPGTAAELFSILLIDFKFRDSQAITFLSDLATQISRQDERGSLWMAMNAIELLPQKNDAFVLPILGRLLKKRHEPKSSLSNLAAEGYLNAVDSRKERLLDTAKRVAADEGVAINQRLASISTLQFGTFSDVGKTLRNLIQQQQPLSIQKASLVALNELSHPEVATILIEAWPTLGPGLRTLATESLFARPERIIALLDAVDQQQFGLRELPRDRIMRLKKSKNLEIAKRSSEFAAQLAVGGRNEVVQKYKRSLDLVGDRGRGKEVFKKNCAACHKLEGFGNELGPNLAVIKNRGPETILVNVLDPSREVNPEYINYVVLSTDGRTRTGMITSESANSVTLSRGDAANDTISRSEIDILQSTGLSIMPIGLEASIDTQSMADLIAYLMIVK